MVKPSLKINLFLIADSQRISLTKKLEQARSNTNQLLFIKILRNSHLAIRNDDQVHKDKSYPRVPGISSILLFLCILYMLDIIT